MYLENKVNLGFSYPISRPLDHTMGFSIDHWANQKIPLESLKECVINNTKIELHSIYPLHFLTYSKQLSFSETEPLYFKHNPRHKAYNYIRPKYFWAKQGDEDVFIIAVTPGKDYLMHYAGLVRHSLSYLTRNYENLLSIHYYPEIAINITEWSGLDERFIQKGDIVIIGFVKEVEAALLTIVPDDFELLSAFTNDYYGSTRYLYKNHTVVNFLGVKYSFWGNISAYIVEKVCKLWGKEVIYIGKLGSLSSPQDLYSKIFSPTSYVTMEYHSIKNKTSNLTNAIAALLPKLDSGLHLSVPTVAEEDITQRELAKRLHINSIDNEISQMAYAISNHNLKNAADIKFSALHFAYDYLRLKKERHLKLELDLSNNRHDSAITLKQGIIHKISKHLLAYLQSQ